MKKNAIKILDLDEFCIEVSSDFFNLGTDCRRTLKHSCIKVNIPCFLSSICNDKSIRVVHFCIVLKVY